MYTKCVKKKRSASTLQHQHSKIIFAHSMAIKCNILVNNYLLIK